MPTPSHMSINQVNAELLQTAETLMEAIKSLSKDPSIDFSLPAFGPVAIAHANLHEAIVNFKTMAVLANAQG